MSSCTKISYPTQAQAYLALRAIAITAKNTGKKAPVDFYPCASCSAFHITSHGKPRRVRRFQRVHSAG